jgi:hypothetical protein
MPGRKARERIEHADRMARKLLEMASDQRFPRP